MRLLKLYRWHILAVVGLCIAYFMTRLYKLDSLPIFTDEAIYMWWAQTGKLDASWRFISLVDGKQPFYIWLSMVAMYGVKDPLLAGRLVSVFAGFLSVIGLIVVGRELFKNWWVGIVAGFFYIVFPFALVHDRMALYDSLVGTLFIWVFYLEVLLVKKIHSTIAFILALVMGAGMLTKTSAFITAALLPTTLLLFNQPKNQRKSKFFLWVGYSILAVGLAYGYYSILRLTPFFGIITTKNAEFVYPLKEWIQHPFTYFVNNSLGIITVLNAYITIPVLLLVIASLFIQKSFWKEKILLLIWFGATLVYLAFFGKVIYPRHFFFTTLFLLPLAALTVIAIYSKIKNIFLTSIIVIVIIGMQLYADFFILTAFAKAPLPDADRFQYISGWPSGGGVKEAVTFFQNESKDKKIEIYTQGTFGLMPYALNIYLQGNTNAHITGIWPITVDIPKEILQSAKKYPTYILFYQECDDCGDIGNAPSSWPLKEILRIKKAEGIYLVVYKVNV
jgi:4-amino-4-deoxy-L-arabinose transferase-like glycosyltransferase